MPDIDSYDHCFKVLIVGDPGVGKSSLLVRYCEDKFSESTSSTIGVDFRTKVVNLRGKRIKLSIWDTAGQEKFRTLTSAYYRNAHGVILMYDATNRDSFDHMPYWLDQVKSQCTYPDVVAMLIAGKLDSPSQLIRISRSEGEIFAVEHSMLFEETSSKSNSKVDLCFEELILNMLDQPKLVATSRPPISSSIHQQSSKILTQTSTCSSSCYSSSCSLTIHASPPSLMTAKKLLIPDFKSLKAAIKNERKRLSESDPHEDSQMIAEEIQSVGPSTQIAHFPSQISFGGIDSQENELPKQHFFPAKRRGRRSLTETSPALPLLASKSIHPSPVAVKRIIPTDAKYFTKFFSWSDNLLELNVGVFGNKNGFREHQLEAVNAVMDQFDVFVILPTGGGKSLIFQLPAVASPGLTVVVMPLVSLINDQVQHMNRLGIPVASLVGEVSKTNQEKIFRDIKDNNVSILYVTPERVAKSQTLWTLFNQLNSQNRLRRFVIDEAHCVSTMGHSFREDYLELKILRSQFPNIPILALTATATSAVVADVLVQLGLRSESVFVVKGSLDRPNLKWQVYEKKRSLTEDICRIIRTDYGDGSSGIIYCLSQAQCEKVAGELRTRGVRAGHYHAAMIQRDRETVQREWMADTIQVVCATIAFGMGINKPNVRFVMHHSLPKSVENLYQEQGRAGRDGIPSRCIVWYDYGDKIRNHGLISSEDRNVDQQLLSLLAVVKYCEDKVTCRRKFFSSHFGEYRVQKTCRELGGAAQQCDVCESGSNLPENIVVEDCTGIGDKIIGVLQEIQTINSSGGGFRQKAAGRFAGTVPHPTAVQLRDILTGTLGGDTANRFKEWSGLRNFACLRGEWGLNVKLMDLIHKMIVDGWIFEICELNNYHGYTGYVKLGRPAGSLICHTPRLGLVDTFQFERAIRSALTESRAATVPAPVQPPPKKHPLSNDQRIELKGAINHMRSQIAKEEKTLPFEVFPDTTVLDLIEQLPQKVDDLEDIDKLNDRKIDMYGERIVECIRGFLEEKGLHALIVKPTGGQGRQHAPQGPSSTSIRLVANSNGDMSLRESTPSTADTKQTYATRFTKKRRSLSSEMPPRAYSSQETTTSHTADEIKSLSDEAIIDLCTSPILPQRTENNNGIQFEDISDEYLQWLKKEGVI